MRSQRDVGNEMNTWSASCSPNSNDEATCQAYSTTYSYFNKTVGAPTGATWENDPCIVNYTDPNGYQHSNGNSQYTNPIDNPLTSDNTHCYMGPYCCDLYKLYPDIDQDGWPGSNIPTDTVSVEFVFCCS